jgi:hypothetical protein
VLFEDIEPYVFNWQHYNIWGYNNGFQIKKNAITKGLCLPAIASVVRRELLLRMPFIPNPHASNDWVFYYHLPDNTHFYGEKQELITYRKHKQADTSSSLTINHCILSHQCIYYDLLEYADKNIYSMRMKIYAVMIEFYIFKNRLTKNFFDINSPYKEIKNRMFNRSEVMSIIGGVLLFLMHAPKILAKKMVRYMRTIKLCRL